MPSSEERDEWSGTNRQPSYRYSDGRHLHAEEPHERRDRHDARPLERRRPSLHRGYHSDNEAKKQDPREDSDVYPGYPKIGKPRTEREGKQSSFAPRLPHRHSVNRVDDWGYTEDDWDAEHDRHPHQSHQQGNQVNTRSARPSQSNESRSLRPGEHDLYSEHSPAEYISVLDPYTTYSCSDDEDHYNEASDSWPEPPALKPGEHVSHLLEDAARPRKHMIRHEQAVSLPRLTRRAPTWKAPESGYPSAEDRDGLQRRSCSNLPYALDPEDSSAYLYSADDLRPRTRPEAQTCARPPHSRSISENLHTIFPDDSRSEAGRLRSEKRSWAPAASTTSSARMSHTTGTVSSVSRVLGPKMYSYKPLERMMDFRLVRVLPERTYKVKCEIVHASLEFPPEYIAISYAWGDGVDTKHLILDGASISVGASLHDALKAVREKDAEVLIWVDGLSIDQQNKSERASQVQLMGNIYSRAKFVAVWLGPDADGSQMAIKWLEEVEGVNRRRVSTTDIRTLEKSESSALRALFKRNYWNRLWVVQEVFLAKETWVYCGSSRLPWEAYEAASDAFGEFESEPHLRRGPSSFPNMLQRWEHSLLEVLRACRKKLSENPRDKVFGVLGMLPEETRKELPVNYDQSVKALYIDVADHIISSTRRLDVIRESIHFPLHVSSAGLPSWCPDWSHIPEISALRERSFSAAGDTEADYEFHDNERKLEFSGIELGTIEATGVAVGTLCALQDYLMAFLHWRALLLMITDIDENDDNNPLIEAFCRTLSLGQVQPQWEQYGWITPCFHVFSSLIQKHLPRLPIDRGLKRYAGTDIMPPNEHRLFVQKHFGDRMMGRTFCVTENGLMGLGTGFMRKGDIVVVPFGCSTPILLRAEGRRNEFRYVGDVYIHGFMHGEALTGKRMAKKYMLH